MTELPWLKAFDKSREKIDRNATADTTLVYKIMRQCYKCMSGKKHIHSTYLCVAAER